MANEWDVVAERPATADDWTVVSETPTGGGPNVTTLEERQEKRAQLQSKLDLLKRQIQELEDVRGGLQPQDYKPLDEAVAGLRREQKTLEAQIERTGVGSTWRNVGATVGGVGGGLGGTAIGAALGNPATAVAGGVAGSAVGTGVGSAVGTMMDVRAAEPITEDEAKRLILNSAVTDVIWDLGGSVGFIVGGKLLKLATTPGLKERLSKLITQQKGDKLAGIARKAGETAQRTAMSADPSDQYLIKEATEDAKNAFAREKAVEEINKRAPTFSLTPGQVADKPGFTEFAARTMHPNQFEEQGKAIHRATRSLRDETIEPTGTWARPTLGDTVLNQTKAIERAVKGRTGPVFEAAKRANVMVDFAPVVKRIEEALAENADAAGAQLTKTERGFLQDMLARLTKGEEDDIYAGIVQIGPKDAKDTTIKMSAGGALNYASALKGHVRDKIDATQLSERFTTVLKDLANISDNQAKDAIGQLQGGALRDALEAARKDYREMATGIFDGNVQRVLGKDPEKIGDIIYATGNVTAVRQFRDMVEMGVREGTITRDGARELNEQMLRGFLREAVPNVKAAAKFSETLNGNVKLKETYEELLGITGTQQLADGMRVLEQAAQMALKKNSDLSFSGSGLLSNLAARTFIGVGLGYISLPTAGVFATAEAWSRLMATSLARNDKGLYRNILIVLRASSTDNPKLMAAARPAAVAVAKAVTQMGDADLESQFNMEALQDVLRGGKQEKK